ncbi:flagellar motor protein MotB [Paeniglutamicibacter antarcticus]|uniref:Flagellar motor protein MotB n=1 Tax=Arthrobacter terrae TaxID=2935737 RepID=A0A931CQ30_9MICC|nr:flagellar motor protein MotB [Arthrobacter terrae]MBG0740300.1 flagellar motor protein MotB [Arthrobacter terrae]
MSARPRRRNFGKPAEQHADERWMASYMDMVTVLMCMFIVLYAMSTVDANKFERLKNSLATGFGVEQTTKVDTATGVVVPPDQVNSEAEGFAGPAIVQPSAVPAASAPAEAAPAEATQTELAEKEVARLTALRDKMAANLSAIGMTAAVKFKIDERGLTVRLVSSETFFMPDDARLTAPTTAVLDAIAPVLGEVSLDVSVEGNAALVPESIPNPQYWEISAARATNVVRHFIDVNKIAQQRMAAVSFGAARPVGTTTAADDLAKNRRVDIVVLSDQPDSVRSLIPQLLKSAGQ